MEYKSNWIDFIKVNYEEIVKLGFYATNNYCDIDFIHDCIIVMNRYKMLDSYDPKKCKIATYVANLIKFQWNNHQKKLSYKAEHTEFMDFNTGHDDSGLTEMINIDVINKIPVSDKERQIIRYRYDRYRPVEIATKLNTSKQRIDQHIKSIKRRLTPIKDKLV
jgi:RNA polymerase sigma factor (sigma-70 family)